LQSDIWWRQQQEERERREKMQQVEKEAFDQQTIQINEYRKQLEEEKAKRLRDMEIAYKQTNSQQLEEKINKEALERQLETNEKLNHIQYVTGHDFYTENTVLPTLSRKPASQPSAGIECCLITGRA
jgi:cystathionine beta-lyase family protein involved in aluminum resistance